MPHSEQLLLGPQPSIGNDDLQAGGPAVSESYRRNSYLPISAMCRYLACRWATHGEILEADYFKALKQQGRLLMQGITAIRSDNMPTASLAALLLRVADPLTLPG
jgi:hypothetical protein